MKLIFQKDPEGSKGIKSFALEEEETLTKKRGRIRMKTCENHDESIVVFSGDACPFCKMEKNLKTIGEEIEKTMEIMKQIQMTAKEAG
jgi:hypothetical protein